MTDITGCLAEIREMLDRLPDEAADGGWEKSSTRWTKHLIGQIRNLGLRLDFEVRPDPDARRASGWLYDLVWLRRNADDSLERAFLVLESEWEPTQAKILEDFEKLLLARADVRIMIFNRRKQSQLLDTLADMDRRIRAFTARETRDHYFLAGLAWESGTFECRDVHL